MAPEGPRARFDPTRAASSQSPGRRRTGGRCCHTLSREPSASKSQARESRNRTSPFVLQTTVGPTVPMPGVEPGVLNFGLNSTFTFLREVNSNKRQNLGHRMHRQRFERKRPCSAASVARDETVRTRILKCQKTIYSSVVQKKLISIKKLLY